jgi:hypothetical protein
MAIGFGMLFTWLLMMLKLRFSWWPVHPVAFPLGLSEVVQEFTPAIFVAWLIKALLLRYGGLRAHRAALPFFLGLIAGHMTFYSLQAVFCLVFGLTPTLW